MATSSIFYRFRSQKDPSRITFDGPYHTIFELKRDIISQNKLGEGSDFELRLYNEEGEEYQDDTTHVSRSSTVVARRSPARIPNKGGAARYVSGRMPINALNAKKAPVKNAAFDIAGGGSNTALGGDEADNLAAMFGQQRATIAARQDELESSMPIRRPANKAEVPDKPPPPGYVCYRCGEKGHWIQACPTNDDPNYVSQPRFKRTTGIPKSMLVKVNRADIENEEERPAGLMLSAEGDWVMAKSDYEEFQKYQAKVRQSKVAQLEEKQGNKELQDRGLECPLDKRLFVDPMKTPCCGKTYCRECIDNALTDNDLHCPGCKQEILFDDLLADEETRSRVREFTSERFERAKEQAVISDSAQIPVSATDPKIDRPIAETGPQIVETQATQVDQGDFDSLAARKRKAETSLESSRTGGGPPPPTAPKGPTPQQQNHTISNFPPNGQNMAWPIPGMQMGGQWPANMQKMPNIEGVPNLANVQLQQGAQDETNGAAGATNWQNGNQANNQGAFRQGGHANSGGGRGKGRRK